MSVLVMSSCRYQWGGNQSKNESKLRETQIGRWTAREGARWRAFESRHEKVRNRCSGCRFSHRHYYTIFARVLELAALSGGGHGPNWWGKRVSLRSRKRFLNHVWTTGVSKARFLKPLRTGADSGGAQRRPLPTRARVSCAPRGSLAIPPSQDGAGFRGGGGETRHRHHDA